MTPSLVNLERELIAQMNLVSEELQGQVTELTKELLSKVPLVSLVSLVPLVSLVFLVGPRCEVDLDPGFQ